MDVPPSGTKRKRDPGLVRVECKKATNGDFHSLPYRVVYCDRRTRLWFLRFEGTSGLVLGQDADSESIPERPTDFCTGAGWLASAATKKPLILDARERDEFEVSHLQGAVSVNSEREVVEALRGVEEDHPIVVYCSVGYRSLLMADRLQLRGFKNVQNLEDSIFQWANEGRPVYAGGIRVERVHPYDPNWGQLLDRRLWSKPP